MAGHSHSANIAHRKGTVDAKRGKLFSKLCRAIFVAARNGGPDPDMNLRLRYAIDKARSAALFRRPSKVFEDAVAGGRTALLALRGAVPIDGGLPLVSGGKIVGAIGASGGTAQQDGQVAKAGADIIK